MAHVKVIQVTGNVGTEQRSNWTKDDVRTLSAINMCTGGRGWSKYSPLVFTNANIDTTPIECVVIGQYPNIDMYQVQLLSHFNEMTVDFCKRPYVRKSDGKCSPNINISVDNYGHRLLCEQYGVNHPQQLIFEESSDYAIHMRSIFPNITLAQINSVRITVKKQDIIF